MILDKRRSTILLLPSKLAKTNIFDKNPEIYGEKMGDEFFRNYNIIPKDSL